MLWRIVLLLIIGTTFCRAQTGSGKTAVFKVRAPQATCSIFTEEKFFWLEKNNIVRVKVRGGGKIQVELTGGKIIEQDGGNYTLFFTSPGTAAISVYKFGRYGRELALTKTYEVRGPTLYFCGIKTDSTSKYLRLRGDNLYAYSDYFKQALPVLSFEMFFTGDTVNVRNAKPTRYKSDTCMLTKEMQYKVLHYQPKYNYIYFHNIVCEVPDGTKRILDPVRLHGIVDTANKKTLSLIYAVFRKEL
ncbi:MAG: hypothetical protein FD123_785 [Bacteroidetes bacterium]|nr:MAG: hypothetical protein FD123_785 [Bacteroidota bacterium]